MHRVVVLGRGGAGKTVLSGRIAAAIAAPVIELDTLFWRKPDLKPLSPHDWVRIQQDHFSSTRWVADGDLGPYDVVSVRLRSADAVVVLDYSLPRCLWRALRRSRERRDFWCWVLSYRRRYLPQLMAMIRESAPHASVQVLRNPRETARWLATLDDERAASRGTPSESPPSATSTAPRRPKEHPQAPQSPQAANASPTSRPSHEARSASRRRDGRRGRGGSG